MLRFIGDMSSESKVHSWSSLKVAAQRLLDRGSNDSQVMTGKDGKKIGELGELLDASGLRWSSW